MKKKLTILAGLLTCLFLFSACSAQVVISLKSNWADGGVAAPTGFSETLTYDIAFEKDDLGSMELRLAEGSSYVVETTVDPSYESFGEYYSVYKLKSTLTLRGTYYDTKNDREIVTFGTTGDANDKPDTVVTEVWFHSLDGGRNLRPIRSVTTGYQHAIDPTSGSALSLANYTVTIDYNKSATKATVQLTNNWTEEDLSDENKNINEYVEKSAWPKTQKFTSGDLQKNYSCFDAGQLYFVGRGLTYKKDASNTVMLATAYGKTQCTFTCKEISDRSVNFSVNGGQAVTTVNTAKVTFSNSGNGQDSGPSRTVYYARNTESSPNYYNVPVRIEETFAYDVGDLIFNLRSVVR